MLSHPTCGSDSSPLLKIYHTHIKSKTDYRIEVYSSASKKFFLFIPECNPSYNNQDCNRHDPSSQHYMRNWRTHVWPIKTTLSFSSLNSLFHKSKSSLLPPPTPAISHISSSSSILTFAKQIDYILSSHQIHLHSIFLSSLDIIPSRSDTIPIDISFTKFS